jgi:hypothetical protein
MKRLAAVLAAAWLLFLLSGGASACLNDRESEQGEREFKSSYVDRPSTPPVAPAESPPQIQSQMYYLMAGGGVVLLACAVLLTVWRPWQSGPSA